MILGLCITCSKEFRKRERKYKFCSLSCANRYNLNGLQRITLPQNGPELAEFVGICLGDGYVSKYQVSITLNSIADAQYIPYVTRLAKKLFPEIHISFVRKVHDNAVDIRLNSRIVSDFFLAMGIQPKAKKVPAWIRKDIRYVNACVRGLFDTEGSISFKLYKSKSGMQLYKQLNFRNTNKELMQLVRDCLVRLNVKPTMSLKKSLYLSNHKGIDVFRCSVGFGNPKLYRRSLIYTIAEYEAYYSIS